MNKYLVTASALAMLVAAPAFAADTAQQKGDAAADVKVIEKTQGGADVKVIREGADASATAGSNVQAKSTQQEPGQIDAAELIGQDIENAAGEDVGEVNSVILGQDGKVEAVIVGVGGFLGIGERDVAIDWNDLSFGNNGEQIVANVTREQLEQMPEYQFADEQRRGTAFESDVAGRPAAPEAREQMAARPATPAEPRGEMNVGAADKSRSSDADVVVKTDKDVDVKTTGQAGTEARGTSMAAGDASMKRPDSDAAEAKQQAAAAQPMDQLGEMSAEQVIGKDVVNLRGEDVGEVEDIVLDQDKAVFAVISVGGFLGMGDKNVAVPVNELKLGENDVIMMSETTEEQLESMPAYEQQAYQPFERKDKLRMDR